MTSTSGLNEKLTIQKPVETDLDVIENGGLSPQLSVRTDDDACSEIIRIDQTPDARPSALGRFVRTLQVFIFISPSQMIKIWIAKQFTST